MHIIDLDAILPKDFGLRWKGVEWEIPGDLSTRRALALQRAVDALQDAKTTPEAEEAFQDLAECVGEILAIRQPEQAKDLEFSTAALTAMAGAILRGINQRAIPPDKAGPEGPNGEAATTP